MSKAKSTVYHLYPRIIDNVTKAMRKHVPKAMKKSSDEALLGEFITYDTRLMETLMVPCMSEEWHWEKHSGVVLMPEDAHMVESLYRARFELDNARHLKFPANSFMIAFPSGCEIDGYPMQPAIVNWHGFQDFSRDFYEPFGRAIGLDMGRGTSRLREGLDPALPALSIVFQDPMQKEGRLRLVVHCDDIPNILRAQSPEEILDIVGNFENSSYTQVIKPSQLDLHIQARLLRLVVAIGVYYTATEGDDTLDKGMPSHNDRFSRPKASYVRPMTLYSLAKRRQKERGEEPVGVEYSEHVRTWHFRQLRHPRYYQGVYADMPSGSRIVFVSDALVTRKRHVHEGQDDDALLASAINQQTLER